MDKIIHKAKDILDDQKEDGQQVNQGQDYQQQQQYPAPGANKTSGGGLAGLLSELDFDDAKEEATKQAGSSGSRDLFTSILSVVSQKQEKLHDEDIDEDDAVKKHQKTYNEDDNEADEKSLGTAAALQALKLFNQGETGGNQSKSAFLGLAMSEASKLFDDKASQGKVSSDTSKESTIQQAAEVALKLFLKSKGEDSGGLLSLASKFLK